jgi:hypothetical protein
LTSRNPFPFLKHIGKFKKEDMHGLDPCSRAGRKSLRTGRWRSVTEKTPVQGVLLLPVVRGTVLLQAKAAVPARKSQLPGTNSQVNSKRQIPNENLGG